MRKMTAVLAGVAVLSVCALAQKRKTPNFPRLIVHATWVYVMAIQGDAYAYDPRIDAQDRQSVFAVEDALKQWGRYKLVMHPDEADIVLVLRRGRIADLKGGISIGGGSNRPLEPGTYTGLEGGTPDDTLLVMPGGPHPMDSAPLWRRSQFDGLKAPALRLFRQFQREVDEAAAATTKP
jgi:hypothetical protein